MYQLSNMSCWSTLITSFWSIPTPPVFSHKWTAANTASDDIYSGVMEYVLPFKIPGKFELLGDAEVCCPYDMFMHNITNIVFLVQSFQLASAFFI